MKTCLLPLCILSCALFSEDTWSTPKAVNENSTLSQFAIPGITLNDSGLAIVNWANQGMTMMDRFLFSAYSRNFGTTWSMPHDFMSMLSGSGNYFFASPITSSGNSVIAWSDDSPETVKASYFTQAGGWGPSTLLSSASSGDFLGYPLSYSIGANDRACVAWREDLSGTVYIKAAFYDSGWQPSLPVAMNSSQSFNIPILAMSPSGEKVMVCWTVSGNAPNPFYSSTFNGTSWDTPIEIAPSTSNTISEGKFCIAINDDGVAVAFWIEEEPSTTMHLYVSLYDPMGSTWSTPHELSSGTTNSITVFIFNLAINQLGHAAIGWGEKTSSPSDKRFAYASFYNGTTWEAKTELYTDSINEDIAPTIALNDSDLSVAAFFSFSASPPASLYIASRKPSSTWTPAIEAAPAATITVFPAAIISLQNELAFVPFASQDSPTEISIKQVVFSDGDTASFTTNTISPSFSTLINPPWVSVSPNGARAASWAQMGSDLLLTSFSGAGLSPPTNGIGFQTESKFLVSTDVINALSWTASSTANVRYNVYRNGAYIATVYGPSYDDHQRVLGEASLYSVTAVNDAGSESSPILFTVP